MLRIPKFSSGAEFDRFCLSMPKDRINKMNTDEWIAFWYAANDLSYKEKCKTADEFFNNHVDAFAHMYSNFRMSKKEAREVKKLAYKMADKLSVSKEFSDLYFYIDVVADHFDSMDAKAAKKMRETVYEEYFGKSFQSEVLKPKIKMRTEKLTHAGLFCEKGLKRHIALSGKYMGFCNTAAHELYHSLQRIGFSRRTKLMEKFGIKVPYDKKMAELYMLNQVFYMESETNRKGYLKQPLEYGARFFATCFERRLRHNLRASENNWGTMYMGSQIFRGVKLFENRYAYGKDGFSFEYGKNLEKTKFMLDEICSRYLKQAKVEKTENTVKVSIPRSPYNIISIHRLYTGIRKAEHSNTVEKGFVKKFMPLSYNKFYASEQEKLLYKPVLSKVKINRM